MPARRLLTLIVALFVVAWLPAAADAAPAKKKPRAACPHAKKKLKAKAKRKHAKRASAARKRPAAKKHHGARRCKVRRKRKRAPSTVASAPSIAAPPAASTPAPPLAAPPPVAPTLFSPTSPWNAPLAPTAALDAKSPLLVGALKREVDREISAGTGPWINELRYSTPIYVVPANQPKTKVKLDTGSWGAPLQRALNQGVPIPPGARPAPGSDAHLTIYQPSRDMLWDFIGAAYQSDGWHARWGGAMQKVSNSPGYFTNQSWSGLSGSEGWNWGSTATGLPAVGGTVTIDDLRKGHIDHALAMAVPEACSRSFTWPAQRTDGTATAADCLPEGARLRLDPTLDLAQLSLPAITRMLAEAAQRYGVIVRDTTHASVGFYAEDPAPTGSDPYHGPDGFYGGLQPWQFLPPFPWSRLQLLKMHMCTSSPCMSS